MKFSILKSAANPYQFAISLPSQEGVKHSTIKELPTLTQAMEMRVEELIDLIGSAPRNPISGSLTAQISPEIELWGAGVTYLRSRDARKEESDTPDVYQKVYEADRPELFFKSYATRARGTGAPIGIRYDSELNVPEPEVAVYINKYREIMGYGICNDVSSRTIEGENPLYLSQAKVYFGSTALGPDITPAWLAPSAADMKISAQIKNTTGVKWSAETSLASLNRTLEDLIDYLFRCQDFPHGAILSTGTGIIPPMEIFLEAGDKVDIEVAGIGTLSNTVEITPERPRA